MEEFVIPSLDETMHPLISDVIKTNSIISFLIPIAPPNLDLSNSQIQVGNI
jgi:hypothetical protein